MEQSYSSLSLKELLLYCSDASPGKREAGWREFIRRYKQPIYYHVTRRCRSWNVSRLKRQLSETVNDIISEVYSILFKSLQEFREVDDERKFQFWLITICNRAAGRYLQRQYLSFMADPDVDDYTDFIGGLKFDTRWELYETYVSKIRQMASSKKRNIERDINIFFFYTWADLSQSMILNHPCFHDLGHRVLDNVVNRIRTSLKEENI